jgi:hypothetical protein
VPDRFCRAIVALAVAPWLAVSPAMPPQHAHETDTDHPHSIVHRHAEGHSLRGAPPHTPAQSLAGTPSHRSAPSQARCARLVVAAPDDEGVEVGDKGERVVWLNDVALSQSVYHVAISWTITSPLFATIDDSPTWVAIESHDESPPHGPPRRCLALRAPPLLAA